MKTAGKDEELSWFYFEMCERRNILCGCTCTDGHTGERRAVDLLVFEVRHLTFPVATLKHEVFLPLRQMATPR